MTHPLDKLVIVLSAWAGVFLLMWWGVHVLAPTVEGWQRLLGVFLIGSAWQASSVVFRWSVRTVRDMIDNP